MSKKMLKRGALRLVRMAEGGQLVVPLDPSRYKNYGEQGGEHLFFPNRAIPGVGTFAQQPGPSLPPNQNPKSGVGDYIPLLGLGAMVGKDIYKWWQKKNPGTPMPPELVAQIEAGAKDVSGTEANNQRDFNNLPMPWINDDGTTSLLNPDGSEYTGGNFWDRMDDAARDTSDTDAYVNNELDHYGDTHEMPTFEADPSLWDRGLSGGKGALDLYIGTQRGDVGGYGQALKGAAKLGESIGYGGTATGMLNKAGGALSGVGNVITGIDQGGVAGYGKAAVGAAQTAKSLGMVSGAGGAAVAKAVPIVNAAISAYGAYNSAAVGDKKGAIAQGAMAGASIGSVVPVIGTAVGAVIGGLVGAVGASFGDKPMESESFYKAYKGLKPNETVRGWDQKQADGAMFEALKSHTKSGNAERFKDVGEMYNAFGVSTNDYRGMQQKLGEFIRGSIETAQKMGGLPKDKAELAKLDGQQIFYKIITPAMQAKIQEATGKQSEGWARDFSKGDSGLQNMMADWTDYMISHWDQMGQEMSKARLPSHRKSELGKVMKKARGGLSTFNEGSMLPRRGGLQTAMAPPQTVDTSYYRYGAQPPQPPARQLPPMTGRVARRAMGGLSLYGYRTGGPNRLVRGAGTGRSDDIPARLSDGEYVMDAETVALLGDGSTDEGARRLDALRQKLRMQKGKQLAQGKFSSAAKNPEEYL